MILYILSLLFYSVSGQGVFNVVRFPNAACGSADGFNGTCYTAEECTSQGGSSSGSCASGFGVCCVFSLACGGRTSANTSYATITSFSTTNDRDPCTYTYCKTSDDVCKLRIDFETMVIADPFTITPTTAATTVQMEGFNVGDCLTDTLTIGVPGMTSPPVICGYNTGQHMYVPACPSCVTITLDIDTGTTATRNWQIKVTQYECGSLKAPEENCLQWHTETSGTFATFNWDTTQTAATTVPTQFHLSDQHYSICFRRTRGYCSMCFSPQIVGTAAGQASSFGVSSGNIDEAGASESALGTVCTAINSFPADGVVDNAATRGLGDYLVILNMQAPVGTALTVSKLNTICGGVWNTIQSNLEQSTICTWTTPFRVGVHFNDGEITGDTDTGDIFDHTENRTPADGKAGFGTQGFQLAYWQNTC